MRCDEVQGLADLWIDGELDVAEAREFAAHVEACPECSGPIGLRRRTKDDLRVLASEHLVSDEFRARLDDVLAGAHAPVEPRPPMRGYFAAAGLGCVVLGWMTYSAFATDPVETIAGGSHMGDAPVVVDESIRWHSRPLPVEVTGPDTTEVRDWFRGKLDFPVAPPDFALRAHLLGGRVGNVREAEAAFLVYDVDGTKLSVMMFERDGAPLSAAAVAGASVVGPAFLGESNGLRVAVHEEDGVAYTFTSDLPNDELVDLVNVAFSY